MLVGQFRNKIGAGEMTEPLRGLAALPEDQEEGRGEGEAGWQNSKSSKFHSQPVSLGRTGSLGIGCALILIWAASVKVPLAEVQSLLRILLGCAVFAPQTGSTYLGSWSYARWFIFRGALTQLRSDTNGEKI